jgi:hypothetical protein
LPSHLFPKEESHTEFATAVVAQAAQTKEHGEKKNKVWDEADDDVKLVGVRVEYNTAWQNRAPIWAELQVDKLKTSKAVEVAYSPAQYLIKATFVQNSPSSTEKGGLALDHDRNADSP